MELRKHQQKAVKLAEEVVHGIERKITVAHATPGSGKTILASAFAHRMIRGGYVDHVVILCPRDSLRSQMQDGFTEGRLGLDLHVAVWDPQKATQKQFIRDVVGVVTTYQAASVHRDKLLKTIRGARTLLILDEGHHLAGVDDDEDAAPEEVAAWLPAVAPLVSAARHVLVMTGTLYRSDKRRIPFVEYTADDQPHAHLKYTRQDALDEGAVLPIEFRMWDGEAEFRHRGAEKTVVLSEADGDDSKRALRTALMDMRDDEDGGPVGYVARFLRNAIDEWLMYRSTVYQSRAIVVCNTQTQAKWVNEYLASIGHRADLAISDERDSAYRIRRFRNGTGHDILVTVGMAYEGLDVPEATHLILLTVRRARPWLEQAVARVTRVNRKCHAVAPHEQLAYVYVSDDKRARQFVDEMMAEQNESVPLRERQNGIAAARGPSTFEPISSIATHRNEASDRAGRSLTAEQQRHIEVMRFTNPELAHLPAQEILRRSVILRSQGAV